MPLGGLLSGSARLGLDSPALFPRPLGLQLNQISSRLLPIGIPGSAHVTSTIDPAV